MFSDENNEGLSGLAGCGCEGLLSLGSPLTGTGVDEKTLDLVGEKKELGVGPNENAFGCLGDWDRDICCVLDASGVMSVEVVTVTDDGDSVNAVENKEGDNEKDRLGEGLVGECVRGIGVGKKVGCIGCGDNLRDG